jgi:polysaccharide export outer membrane protein
LAILKFSGVLLLSCFICCSCSVYKQNIMFKLPKGQTITQQVQQSESNYIIQKNDKLELSVYTNKGEKIIDPSFSALQSTSSSSSPTANGLDDTYLVNENGIVKFPMLDEIKLEGLTLRDAEAVLQKNYATYYQEPFVILKYANKRVVVLGAVGGQVIPLLNENMKLTEIIALAKGINTDGKATNIRILRNDVVMLADLSTIDGYLKNNIIIQPNDIIYVEPIRKPFLEGFRDYGPLLGVFTSLTTLAVLIITLTNNPPN